MKPDFKIRLTWKRQRVRQKERLLIYKKRFYTSSFFRCNRRASWAAFVYRKKIGGTLAVGWVWVAEVRGYWFAYPTKDEAIAGATQLVLEGLATRVLKRRPKDG